MVTEMPSLMREDPSSARASGEFGPTLAWPSERRMTRLMDSLERNFRISSAPLLTPAKRAVPPAVRISRIFRQMPS